MVFGGVEVFADTTVFSDNFNDNVIDSTAWTEVLGYNVLEAEGILKLEQNATDNGGRITSRLIPIQPDMPLEITRRLKIHYANNNHASGLFIKIDGAPEHTFGLIYGNQTYQGGIYCPVLGFFI